MSDGTEIIAIHSDALRTAGEQLVRVGDEVDGVGSRIAAQPISAPAFGVMNAWMAPPIDLLVQHTAEVVQVAGALAAAVGAGAELAADDFARSEAAAVADLRALEQRVDEASARTLLR
jgi:hypothetical protein